MALYTFGAGTLWGTTTDAVPEVIQFGTLQEVSVDISSSTKQLFGSKQYPVAVGRGTSKVTGKAKFAALSGQMIGKLYFGVSPTNGQTTTVNGEAGSVPAASTYTITVAQSSTWTEDLGVVYAATGLPMTRVATVSAAGQYSVAAGVYTFYSTDASTSVKISYKYTVASTGQKLVVPNALLGTAPIFGMTLENKWSANKEVLTLYKCIGSKFSLSTKLEDFKIPEFDFEAFCNDADNLLEWSFSDQS